MKIVRFEVVIGYDHDDVNAGDFTIDEKEVAINLFSAIEAERQEGVLNQSDEISANWIEVHLKGSENATL